MAFLPSWNKYISGRFPVLHIASAVCASTTCHELWCCVSAAAAVCVRVLGFTSFFVYCTVLVFSTYITVQSDYSKNIQYICCNSFSLYISRQPQAHSGITPMHAFELESWPFNALHLITKSFENIQVALNWLYFLWRWIRISHRIIPIFIGNSHCCATVGLKQR